MLSFWLSLSLSLSTEGETASFLGDTRASIEVTCSTSRTQNASYCRGHLLIAELWLSSVLTAILLVRLRSGKVYSYEYGCRIEARQQRRRPWDIAVNVVVWLTNLSQVIRLGLLVLGDFASCFEPCRPKEKRSVVNVWSTRCKLVKCDKYVGESQ